MDSLKLKGATTSENLVNALSALPLQSLSDEELTKVRATLSLKLSEADWIMNCRKHHKIHFHPDNKTTD